MQPLRFAAMLAATSCFALAGCASDGSELGEPQATDGPAAPGSQAPNLSVGLDGVLYLSWVEPREGGHALRFLDREQRQVNDAAHRRRGERLVRQLGRFSFHGCSRRRDARRALAREEWR
jgi:hypothetical protein